MTNPVVYKSGTQKWFWCGEIHRDDGPASINANGELKWYQRGKLHRDDGPAVEKTDGTLLWYRHGSLHRIDGPAISNSGTSDSWYVNGVRCNSANEYKSLAKLTDEDILAITLIYGDIR